MTTIHVQKAHTALHELLTISTECLNTTPEATTEPGSAAASLKLLIPFLSDVVSKQQLALPAVLDESRDINDRANIYEEDLESLPIKIREKFEQIKDIITLANKANEDEQQIRSNYEELTSGVSDSTIKEWYQIEVVKSKEI